MWEEYIISFLESIFWIFFEIRYHGEKRVGLSRQAGRICVVSCLTLNIWFADYYTLYSSYTFLIDLLVLILYSNWFLEGKWRDKIFSIFLFYIGIFSCNFICMALFRVIFSVPVELLVTHYTMWRISYLLSTKVLLFSFGILLLRGRKQTIDEKRNNILLLIISGLTISIACVLMELFVQYYNYGGKVEIIVILLLLIVSLMVICFCLFRHLIMAKERMLENYILYQQIKQQEKTYNQMQSYMVKSRRLQHDIKHKLVVAEQLLCQGYISEGEKYLRNYLEELEGVSRIRVGENAWQTMILMKKEAAEAKGILFYTDIQSQRLEKIEELDLCVLLGNILDNALEAEEKLSGYKEVRITIREEQRNIIIKIENYIIKSVLKENGELKTTKSDSYLHGLGIGCMKEVVKRYNGRLKLREYDNRFIVEVIL